ncbi:hypothetical protein [Treponema bryantii]|uniref:hypothetical protein n=1 Tax=Treponema bryantii TaxID=163 RepID=UPI0003B62555|nr:hypothetical protein [Treponema bryantii]
MIAANKKAGLENKEAIEKAVDQAIKENLLEGFFKIHRAEVIGMCLEEVSEEEQRRIWHEDGFTEGINKGRSEKAIEGAINLLKMKKLSPEEIADAQELSLKQVLELQEKVFVKA